MQRITTSGLRSWWAWEGRRQGVAALAGLMWAMAFPEPGIAGLAWVAPGLMWHAAAGLAPAGAFRTGYVAGLVQALVSLRWLLSIPHPAGAVAGWLALSGYCAVYPGLWLLWGAWIRRAATGDDARPWREAAEAHASIPWHRRMLVPLGAATGWVALEWLKGWVLTGFPWNALGVTQWRQVPLVQLAGLTGVHGLSLVVCWMSVALAGAGVVLIARPKDRWGWMAEVRLPLLVVLACLGAGFHRVMEDRRDERQRAPRMLRMALVQPAIPQTLLWDPAERGRSFAVAARLTRAALGMRPDVVVWPEGDFGLDRDRFASMTAEFSRAGVRWVFSANDEGSGPDAGRTYNAAFAVGRDGRVAGTYRKRRLVLFGEYVPLANVFPFLRHLTPIGERFAAGRDPVTFDLDGAVASPVICFEDVFPDGVRAHVLPGTDLLLELTNDGWFGRGAAQWQHLANAVFRAVENGVALVRCTNNGVTGWVDATGVVREQLGERGDAVHAEGFVTVRVPVGMGRAGRTFYARHGNVLAWGCLAATCWITARARLGRRTSP
jgi:apolipoprotein N-acyltransferase